MADEFDAGLGGRQRLEPVPSSVAGAVVHDDELQNRALRQHGADDFGDGIHFVIDRHDGGQARGYIVIRFWFDHRNNSG